MISFEALTLVGVLLIMLAAWSAVTVVLANFLSGNGERRQNRRRH